MSRRNPRSAEARKVLRDLDSELQSASDRLGQALVWSAAETATLNLIAAEVDRKVDLTGDYEAATSPSARIGLSAELRLLESSLAKLLASVKTGVPQPKSYRQMQASRAARARWSRSDRNAVAEDGA